jgi:uncharacterized protein YbjQ (UPF0145 family)
MRLGLNILALSMLSHYAIGRAMPKLKFIHLLLIIALTSSATSMARDKILHLMLSDALGSPEAKQKLDPAIRLYFGDQAHGATVKHFVNVVTNKKTNSFGKNAKSACEHVLLSAALALQNRARQEGGNAVVNIESYFKKQVFRSQTEFECAEGTAMAGVALRGDVVNLSNP